MEIPHFHTFFCLSRLKTFGLHNSFMLIRLIIMAARKSVRLDDKDGVKSDENVAANLDRDEVNFIKIEIKYDSENIYV